MGQWVDTPGRLIMGGGLEKKETGPSRLTQRYTAECGCCGLLRVLTGLEGEDDWEMPVGKWWKGEEMP